MNCIELHCQDGNILCVNCQKQMIEGEVRLCPRYSEPMIFNPLTEEETNDLFPDKTLFGERIKQITDAFGFPPCIGCDKRRIWINKAHLFLRGLCGSK